MVDIVDGPLRDPERIDELAPLWMQLQAHHLVVAAYQPLLADLEQSWQARRRWYRHLLSTGSEYFVARDDDGTALGYCMARSIPGKDDTFVVRGGIVDVQTLVVDGDARGRGVGTALLAAVEQYTRDLDMDTMQIEVMVGNDRAESLYASLGFRIAEHVMYRHLDD